jgi:putative hydrolase
VSNDEPGAGHGHEGEEPEKQQPGGPDNPFAGFDLGAMFGQLQSMFSWQGGPINWNLAMETAKQTIRAAGDASLTAEERSTIDQTVRLAEHWLDDATSLPAASAGAALAWNRAEWLDGTLPAWKKLIEPLATHVVGAMEKALPEQPGPMGAQLTGVLTQVGGMMFGAQVGQGLGQLATEVFGSTDTGLPLGPDGRPVLLPANVAAFGAGLGLPDEDVRLYLTLRECAHQRLFHHASWLSAHLFSAVEDYARGMHVDTSKLEDLAGRIVRLAPRGGTTAPSRRRPGGADVRHAGRARAASPQDAGRGDVVGDAAGDSRDRRPGGVVGTPRPAAVGRRPRRRTRVRRTCGIPRPDGPPRPRIRPAG